MLIHFVLFASSVGQTHLGTANIHGKPTKEQLPDTGDHCNIKKAVSYNTNKHTPMSAHELNYISERSLVAAD